jgi:hypothetical protein
VCLVTAFHLLSFFRSFLFFASALIFSLTVPLLYYTSQAQQCCTLPYVTVIFFSDKFQEALKEKETVWRE